MIDALKNKLQDELKTLKNVQKMISKSVKEEFDVISKPLENKIYVKINNIPNNKEGVMIKLKCVDFNCDYAQKNENASIIFGTEEDGLVNGYYDIWFGDIQKITPPTDSIGICLGTPVTLTLKCVKTIQSTRCLVITLDNYKTCDGDFFLIMKNTEVITTLSLPKPSTGIRKVRFLVDHICSVDVDYVVRLISKQAVESCRKCGYFKGNDLNEYAKVIFMGYSTFKFDSNDFDELSFEDY
ncbi:hypothetical protein QTN25_007233 [Entamoeba marina]